MHNCGWLGGLYQQYLWDSDRDWRLYTVVRDGSRGVASLYLYGQLIASGPFSGGPNGLTLGGGSDADLGELLVHNGALSDADRVQLEGRLARRFRLAHRLPAIHPFFSRAPSFASAPVVPAGPLQWLRPEDLPLAGYAVAAWPNAGTGGDVCNAVAMTAQAPTSYGPNGALRSVCFNATLASPLQSAYTACNGGALLANYTLTYVARVWGRGGRVMQSRYAGGHWIVGFWESGSDAFYQNGWTSYGRAPASAGEWQLYSIVRYATGNMAFFSSGVQLQWTAGSLQLGSAEMGDEVSPDADVAEVLVYDRSLPDAERVSLESYLAARYDIPGYRANPVVTASASATPLPTVSISPSTGATPSPSASPSPSVFGCSVDESFASFAPGGVWTASPAGLVTTPASAPARGIGAVVSDPLDTGSPFGYLLSGGTGNYTTLSLTIDTPDSQAEVSFDALFDAGEELPFNAEAAVVISRGDVFTPKTAVGAGITGSTVTAVCPSSLLISGISFASFGNPNVVGADPQSFAIGSCHAANSVEVVAAACVGRSSCSVPSSAAAFGPVVGVCTSTPRLVFVATCSSSLLSQGNTVLFLADVSAVGAYRQTGWRHITTTLQPGRYTLLFAVRAIGRSDPARASALAVDNVRVCLSPPVTPTASSTPAASAAPLACPAVLASGNAHTCGVTQSSRLVCFGDNSNGQTTVPAELVFAEVVGVAAGSGHTCVILAGSGAVRCFGRNDYGQINVPAALYSGVSAVRSVEAGYLYTCATLVRGTLVCWGYLGAAPAALVHSSQSVSIGCSAACGLAQGRVVCWGNTPQPPAWATPARAIWVSKTYWLICAEMLVGGVTCWGHGITPYNNTAATAVGPTYKFQDKTLTLTSSGNVLTDSMVLSTRNVFLSVGVQHYCLMRVGGALSCVGIDAPPQVFMEPCEASRPVVAPLSVYCGSFGQSASFPAQSCADAYESCALTSSYVWVQPIGATVPYQSYCRYDGWALALNVLGGGFNAVFEYNSPLWNTSELLLPPTRA